MRLTRPELVSRLRAAGCVFAEEEAELLLAAPVGEDERAAMVQRRVTGEPLEHVLGWAEIAGVRALVGPGVFVPRRRSAFMISCGLVGLPQGGLVVDLCCGSGALGLAVARTRPDVELAAADVDPVAVDLARRNLAGIGTAYIGDLYDALPARLRGHVDLLLVNAPYVPTDEIVFMPSEARDHEPRFTLDGGADGLDVHRRVAASAPDWLAPAGRLLIETSKTQAPVASALFAAAGLIPMIMTDDDLGATVVQGSR